MTRALLITDNIQQLNSFIKLLKEKKMSNIFDFAYSPKNNSLKELFKESDWIKPIDVKASVDGLIDSYDLIISLHCKQLFPAELVKRIRCINIHPGYNPYNRGWFPQVFSINNGLPLGATIHEIDKDLDHGSIICQKKVAIYDWDTSLTAYQRVLQAELELLDKHLANIVSGQYETTVPAEGNLNLKEDFEELCKLNLDDEGTLGEHIDLLRSLTHGEYKNGFFRTKEGKKVYVRLSLEAEE